MNLKTAIEVLGPVGVVTAIFTFNLTKTGIGAVMAFYSVYVLQQEAGQKRKPGDNNARIKLGPLDLTMKGGLACLFFVAGFVLILVGGSALREEIPQAIAHEIGKRSSSHPNAPDASDLNSEDK